MHTFLLCYDPKVETRLSEQRRAHLSQHFRREQLSKKAFRRLSFVVTQRLSAVFKPFPSRVYVVGRDAVSSPNDACCIVEQNSLQKIIEVEHDIWLRFFVPCCVLVPPCTQPDVTRNCCDKTCWYFVLVTLYTVGSISYICNDAIYIHYRN